MKRCPTHTGGAGTAAILALAVAVALAACGGASPGSGTPSSTPSINPTPTPTPNPAAFDVVSLKSSRTYVASGGIVTVTAEVGNTGDLSGAYTASLKLDGKVVARQKLTVSAHDSAAATFKLKLQGEKSHKLTLADQSISVRSTYIVRYPTGGIMRWSIGHGPGQLNIENDGATDGVVMFTTTTSKPRAKVAVYVRGNSTATVRRIPDGDYYFYYVLGRQWSPKLNRFLTIETSQRFEDVHEFSTEYSGGGYTYSIWSIGLTPTYGGTASTVDVPQTGLPSMD